MSPGVPLSPGTLARPGPLVRIVRRTATAPIRLYQRYLSRYTPPSCRFRPTCSAYATEAIELHGLFRGGWLSLRRILRCHPFTPPGPDPVPGSTAPPPPSPTAPSDGPPQRSD